MRSCSGYRPFFIFQLVISTLIATLLQGSPAALGADRVDLVVDVAGEKLVGTLALPGGEGPFPVVVLIHGAEPGQRSHRGYQATADLLKKQGVGAFIWDKRGVGESGGTYVEAPDLAVPAGDVIAWVELLREREDVRKDGIGVMGWSQGGWIGPIAASRCRDISFVISVSGPGVSPLDQNVFDKTNQFRASGGTESQAREFERVIRLVWTYLVSGDGRSQAQEAWDAAMATEWFPPGYHGPPMMDRDRVLADPRMQSYVAHSSYEPAPVLESLEVPMLAVFGGADTIVPVEPSVAIMVRAFEGAGRPGFTYRVFPGADHGLRIRDSDGNRNMAPGYEKFLLRWLRETLAL